MAEKKNIIWTTGRRKTAVARVRLMPGGGTITVNERTLDYGEDGRKAVTKLLAMGHEHGIIPHKAKVKWVSEVASANKV